MKLQEREDLVKAISEIAAGMPLTRAVQLYEYAIFLESHPLSIGETPEEILADETLWDTQFAATPDDKLEVLVASVKAEISEGKTLPMFDECGEFVERK